jgi:hypothetical protein
MSEFERCKQTVGSRTILITSWFDESHQTWRANAPDYAHLSELLASSRVECFSRKAAVDRLSHVLAEHFAAIDG